MTVACVIPARYQSVRFPGKLLAKAQGKTVLQRTFEQARRCPELDALFVATDDERIAEHVQSLGGEVIWTPPHCRNGTERIGEALQKEDRLQKTSMIVNLQGDHPCTEPKTIGAIITALREDPSASVSTAATRIDNPEDFFSPHVVKCVFDQERNALYFSRSPIPYTFPGQPIEAYSHIGIYCYRTPFLKKILTYNNTRLQNQEDLEQLKVLENGHRIKIALVEDKALGVDTPQDLEKLEKLLCQLNIFS